VTLEADIVPGETQLCAVWLVAVAAGDTGCKHLALFERSVIVDLVEHLPVSMIEPACERRDDMRVGQPLAGNPIFREGNTARVAKSAGLDLLA
jgi:hypothetical protein